LLGQNVNSYRDPSPEGWDFATLLARVAGIPGIRRVRYTTSHPRDFTKAIVEAMDAHPALCDHVHLPVQSGSSRVLRSMDRLYTREQYMERIGWIKNARRQISLTTDIIVGFPGETEQDFQATMDLLDEVQYDSLFSFKYSPRPNTAALGMENKVPEEEKTRRLMALQEKQRAIQIRRNSELVGRVEEVLVEGRHDSLGQWIGRTSQNRILNFTHPETGDSLLGKYLPVMVTRAGPNSLVGEKFSDVV
jgi:tRNA-2-methylthio-N6-dimethylallyladenosine synthase